ncbi:class I SAM-dependent methyltransferase [Leptospira sp. GIMC2001]|uniref:class I SAM-dependent methyltransferase n=1 Tax=Leptospira sp. GIMC2001 TaxID=1513297 RepID=UPI00234BE7A0|nr:class I SAM-dependent methyltransferase [Leptospira sp. GIMC2001]WCL49430.1 class I SAM-dependent methyltransferase [Leptospira sp. GIMC2001]
MNHNCILCESQDHVSVFDENGIAIVKCSYCGHVYSTYEQDEHYEGYWDDPTEEFDLEWWDTAHRDIYDDFINRFLKEKNGKLLDIGCGLGFFVKKVGSDRSGWTAIGYEISERAVAFAREKNRMDNVHSGLVQDSGIEKSSLDIVTLWDVIEHIPKPHSLLDYINSVLKPGGVLFMQTPNFPFQLWKAKLKVLIKGMKPGVHYLEAKDHVNNYYMETLARLGEQTGFENPKYYILKPIMSVAGSKSKLALIAKVLYYHVSRFIFWISRGRWNISNTLFVTMTKKKN